MWLIDDVISCSFLCMGSCDLLMMSFLVAGISVVWQGHSGPGARHTDHAVQPKSTKGQPCETAWCRWVGGAGSERGWGYDVMNSYSNAASRTPQLYGLNKWGGPIDRVAVIFSHANIIGSPCNEFIVGCSIREFIRFSHKLNTIKVCLYFNHRLQMFEDLLWEYQLAGEEAEESWSGTVQFGMSFCVYSNILNFK